MKQILQLLLISTLFASCYTQKKATLQVTKAQGNYPTMVAGKCALWYPPKIYDSVRTEYIQGETEYYIDTIKVDCDSVVNISRNSDNLSIPKIVYKYIKVYKPRVDTIFDHQYHTIENTARLEMLVGRLDSTNNYLIQVHEAYKTEKNNKVFWMKLAIFLCCYLVLKTALRLYFPTLKLLNKLP